jgi:hypothetical protein
VEMDNPQPANSMFYTNTTFIGIDPTAGQKPFAYAALDRELDLLALGQGEMDEVLAFVAGQRQAVVAVCAPQQPNQGLMAQEDYRQSLSPSPRPGRWLNFRVVEYLLRQHNISIPQTAAGEQDCQNWMRMGFQLFRRLKTLGYHLYPADGTEKLQMMEIYPHACYTALLGLLPFPKNSLEGRLQRQLVLHEQRLDVPDAMRIFEEITRYRLLNGMLALDNLYLPGELDALVAAYTAWLAITKPQESMVLGDPKEGQIVLPVPELKERY